MDATSARLWLASQAGFWSAARGVPLEWSHPAKLVWASEASVLSGCGGVLASVRSPPNKKRCFPHLLKAPADHILYQISIFPRYHGMVELSVNREIYMIPHQSAGERIAHKKSPCLVSFCPEKCYTPTPKSPCSAAKTNVGCELRPARQ